MNCTDPIKPTAAEERQYRDFHRRLQKMMLVIIAGAALFVVLALTYGCQPAHP